MGNYVWPCPRYSRVSSGYGNRTCPFHGKEFHDGIDLAAASGTPILAAAPGTVTRAGKNGGYGNYISIDHGGGLMSFYAHCKALYVSKGSKVSAGQKIAAVGTTGSSTGNHLHFGMHKNGSSVNPQKYVKASDTLAKYSGAKGNTSDSSGSGNQEETVETEKKDITTVVLRSVTGSANVQKNSLTELPAYLQNGIEILIQNDRIYGPCIEGDVKLERNRKGSPSKLTFTVMKDDVINFQEGNPVTLRFNGTAVFAGFVFIKSRSDYHFINVTCYDQIRYLKNKDTISYSGKTYGALLKMIAADYGLKCGVISDTSFVIPQRIEEGTLLDILQNASDLTVLNTGKLFVLYDDFGKLTLKNIQDMKLDLVVDEDTAQSYSYESSIDKETYNRIKLAVDNDETGEREVYVLNDAYNQGYWGQLQYYEKLDSKTSSAVIRERAKVLLKYYNKKNRSLKIQGVMGDMRVRGGSLLVVIMGLGDINVRNYMCVETVTHTWTHGLHTMDLTLVGIKGEFIA